jgi:hypothetical protein
MFRSRKEWKIKCKMQAGNLNYLKKKSSFHLNNKMIFVGGQLNPFIRKKEETFSNMLLLKK